MTKSPHLEVFNPAEFDSAVADEIVAAINDSIAEYGDCNIVLAGGKTPAGIYRLLSRPPRSQAVKWQNVKIFLSDERYVPADSPHSNFHLIEETLLSKLPIAGDQVFAFDLKIQSREVQLEDFESRVRLAYKLKEDGLPRIDICLLGLGEDGHTASIFKNYQEPQIPAFAANVDVDVEFKERITLSSRFLISSKKIYFIIKGKSKAGVISGLISGKERYPASEIFLQAKHVTCFCDAEAARLLEKDLF